ncbi:MAG: pilin [bacterium]
MKYFKFITIVLGLAFLALSFATVFAADFSLNMPKYDENVGAGEQLVSFLEWAFTFAIAAAGILALLMIMIGGFQYITAAGSEAMAGQAKNRIQNAILGLVLALCSYLILNTINPDLVTLHLPGFEPLSSSDFNWEDFLPEEPKAGDEAHDVLDGGICATKLDCYHSRECVDKFICPANKVNNYLDQASCETAESQCYNDPNTTDKTPCIPTKICEAVKPDPKNPNRALDGRVLYGEKCENISTDICYDAPEVVCHSSFDARCHVRSDYWQPCERNEECKNSEADVPLEKKLHCDTKNKRCTTEDDSLPGEIPGETPTEEPIFEYSPDGKYAIVLQDYIWSDTSGCNNITKPGKWKQPSGFWEEVCQMRWPNAPTKDASVKCDAKKQCAEYQWAEAVEGIAATCENSYGKDWKKEDDKTICQQIQGNPAISDIDCCKQQIVCCRNEQTTGESAACNMLNLYLNESQKKVFEWKQATGGDKPCRDLQLGPASFIKFYTDWGTNPLPATCCEKTQKK